MNSNQADSAAEDRVAQGTSNAAPSAADEYTNTLRRARGWLALAGLLAGLAAFGAGEVVYGLIPAEKVKTKVMGQIVNVPSAKTVAVAEVRNAAVAFGLLGVFLGGLVGASGGLARRSTFATSGAGGLGAILGVALGVLVSFGLIPFFLDVQPYHPEYDLILGVFMHAAVWGLTAAAAGLAFAVGLGERRLIPRAVAASFVGAVLGAIVFEVVGAAIFPLAGTGQPVSTNWPSRLLARLLVTVVSAAFLILSLSWPVPASGSPRPDVLPPAPS